MNILEWFGKFFRYYWPAIAKAMKLLKIAKIAFFGSSIAAYGWLYGWKFGIILVCAIAFHEYGHTRAMRLVGVQPRGIWMIPFMGGVAFMDPPETRYQEAIIALGGPVFGLVSVFVIAIPWFVTNNPAWIGYASIVALVNLVNLFPIGILDGGRVLTSIMASINGKLGIVTYSLGICAGIATLITMHVWILSLVIFTSLIEILAGVYSGDYFSMPKLSPMMIFSVFTSWVSLFSVFVFLMWFSSLIPGVDLAINTLKD